MTAAPVDHDANGEAERGLAAVGRTLREAREARGLSLEDLAGQLNLAPETLRALEEADRTALPAAVYVRGYVRALARRLGLDGEALRAALTDLGTEDVPLTPTEHGPRRQRRSGDLPVRAMSYVIATTLVALLVAWWWDGREARVNVPPAPGAAPAPPAPLQPAAPEGYVPEPAAPEASMPAAPVPEATVAEPAALEATAPGPAATGQSLQPPPEGAPEAPGPALAASGAPREPGADEGGAEGAAATPAAEDVAPGATTGPVAASPATAPAAGEASPAPQAPRPGSTQPPAQAPAPALPPPVTERPRPVAPRTVGLLRLSVADDAWIEVYDAGGQRLFYDLARAGRTVELEGTPPLRLRLGNAQAVTLEWNGREVALEPFTRAGIARLRLDESGATPDRPQARAP